MGYSYYSDTDYKTCKRCGQSKLALTNFTKNSGRRDGHCDYCKPCDKAYRAVRAAASAPRIPGMSAAMAAVPEYDGAPLIGYRMSDVFIDADRQPYLKGVWGQRWDGPEIRAECKCNNPVKDVTKHLLPNPNRWRTQPWCGIHSFNDFKHLRRQEGAGLKKVGVGDDVRVITVNLNHGVVVRYTEGYRSEFADIVQMILIAPGASSYVHRSPRGRGDAIHGKTCPSYLDQPTVVMTARELAMALQERFGVPVTVMTPEEAGLTA